MIDQPQRVSRTYDSSGRRATVQESRRRIIAAAHELFTTRGYGATSVAAVAKAAGVSTPTVYAAYGTKARLLKEAIDIALAGDDDDAPVLARPLGTWVYEAETADELVRRYAAMMGVLGGRAAPIYDVLVR